MAHLVIHCRDLTSVVVPGHLIFCNKTYDFKVASTPRWRILKQMCKRSKCFPSTHWLEEFQNNHWIICELGQGNHVIIVTSSFSKAQFSKCFPSTRKRKAGVFKFLRFKERIWKAPISWRFSVEGRPNRGNKAAFSNFSGVVWKLPKMANIMLTLGLIVNMCIVCWQWGAW